MNPDKPIVWVNTWYDPVKNQMPLEPKPAQGCDVIAQHTDSNLFTQTAEAMGHVDLDKHPINLTLPKAQLTATIHNWSSHYIAKVQVVLDGTWTTGTYFGDISECDATGCAVGMAPFTNMP